jgi:hypothetical protein
MAAGKPTTKRANSARKKVVGTTERNITIVAAKEPTKKTATKRSSAKRRGSGRSPSRT